MTLSPLAKAVAVFAPVLAAVIGLYFSGIHIGGDSNNVLAWIQHVWSGSAKDIQSVAIPISEDPVVIYIQNFITPEEAAHLVRLA